MLALPFAANNPAVGSISFSETDWGGKVGLKRLNHAKMRIALIITFNASV